MAEIKTIHTKIEGPRAQRLIKELYKKVLHGDDIFHFFYEPELIIRTTLFNQVSAILNSKRVKYEIYKYPVDLGKKGNYCFECDELKLKNLELFKRIYHQHAVLALIWKDRDYAEYINSIEHTACNMRGMNYLQEARRHMEAAFFRYQLNYSSYINSVVLEKK